MQRVNSSGRPGVAAERGGTIYATFFQGVRIPADRDKDRDADRVQLGIRIIDRLQTHWCLLDDRHYLWHRYAAPEAEQWKELSVEFANPSRGRWEVFPSDGNWLYCAEKPDVTAILALVIEVGKDTGGIAPTSGRGVIEVADFSIT